MKWYAVDKEYINYLKQYDNIVPNNDYGRKMKCFLGVVIKGENNLSYFAPLTSYKEKFDNIPNKIDFYKIVDRKTNKKYGAINLNNMIPVPQNELEEVELSNIDKFREFSTDAEKRSYWGLLKKELEFIDDKTVKDSAEKLYHYIKAHPDSRIAQRCCNFPLLEEKSQMYKSEHKQTAEPAEQEQKQKRKMKW